MSWVLTTGLDVSTVSITGTVGGDATTPRSIVDRPTAGRRRPRLRRAPHRPPRRSRARRRPRQQASTCGLRERGADDRSRRGWQGGRAAVRVRRTARRGVRSVRLPTPSCAAGRGRPGPLGAASAGVDDGLDVLEVAAQLPHLTQDRGDHRRRTQRRLATGTREVVDPELQHLVAEPGGADHQLGIDERALAAQARRGRTPEPGTA